VGHWVLGETGARRIIIANLDSSASRMPKAAPQLDVLTSLYGNSLQSLSLTVAPMGAESIAQFSGSIASVPGSSKVDFVIGLLASSAVRW
jgi:hypothetical protein